MRWSKFLNKNTGTGYPTKGFVGTSEGYTKALFERSETNSDGAGTLRTVNIHDTHKGCLKGIMDHVFETPIVAIGVSERNRYYKDCYDPPKYLLDEAEEKQKRK